MQPIQQNSMRELEFSETSAKSLKDEAAMNSHRSPINLVTKLSHSSQVLAFYDNFLSCKMLMTQLSKATRQAWFKNEKAYVYCIDSGRRTLKYNNPFDNNIALFLSEHDRYLIYDLEITLDSVESADSLINFINQVKYGYKLNFTHITPVINEELPLYIEKIHQSVVELGMNESVFYLKSSDLQKDIKDLEGYTNFKFPFFGEITLCNPDDLDLCESIECIRIPRYGLQKVEDISVPVKALEIYCPMALEDIESLKFSSIVKKSVKSIYIDSINYESSPDLPRIISLLKQKLLYLEEIKVGNYDSTQINNGLFDVLFDKRLGVKLPNICSKSNYSIPVHLTKSNMLVYYREKNKVRFMRAKKGEIDLQAGNSTLVSHSKEFLVFKNFDLFTLEDINMVRGPTYEQGLFENFVKSKKEFKNRDKLVIVQNQGFD